MPPEIRQLAPADTGLAAEMVALFGTAFGEEAEYAAAPPGAAYHAHLLAMPHVIALVALHGGAVIGGLVAYDLPKFERARSEIYLYDLAVAEPHRRRGVARALIARLQEIARDRGAWVIYVQADYVDPPAVALYDSLGTREEVLHFDIPPAD